MLGDLDKALTLAASLASPDTSASLKSANLTKLTMMAERGHPLARISIARCYAEGIGVPKDEAKAAEWQQKISDSKREVAQSAERQMAILRRIEAEQQKNGKGCLLLLIITLVSLGAFASAVTASCLR